MMDLIVNDKHHLCSPVQKMQWIKDSWYEETNGERIGSSVFQHRDK